MGSVSGAILAEGGLSELARMVFNSALKSISAICLSIDSRASVIAP